MSSQDLRVHIFRGDVFMRILKARNSTGKSLLSLPVLVLITLAGYSATYGQLRQPQWLDLLCVDVKTYLLAINRDCGVMPATSSAMTLSRDLPNLLASILLALTPFLMYRQWKAIESFLTDMDDRGLVEYPQGRSVVVHLVRRCNIFYMRAAPWGAAVMLASIFSVLLLVEATKAGNIYPLLQRSGSVIEYRHWWAATLPSYGGWLAYVFWGSVFVYAVVTQNIFGGRMVLLAWQLRKAIHLNPDPDSTDGENGWGRILTILRCTWGALMIHGACIALVALSVPGERVGLMAPLFLQWLVTAPLYVLIPVSIIRRNLSRWREAELQRLEQQYRSESSLPTRQAISIHSSKVRGLRINPYAGLPAKFVAALATISTLGLVFQVIRNLYF